MTAPHHRKLKLINLAVGANNFECQVRTWQIVNNTEDGEKQYTYCPDGEFREDSDPDYALELTFFSDWRSGGISDFLVTNDGQQASFTLDHHPDIAAEHVQWSGDLYIKAPSVGGDARSTETQDVTLQIIGKPDYVRV